jgi:hypothetical protein
MRPRSRTATGPGTSGSGRVRLLNCGAIRPGGRQQSLSAGCPAPPHYEPGRWIPPDLASEIQFIGFAL